VKRRSSLVTKAISSQLSAISSYPETRYASRDTSDDLLLLADFFSILPEVRRILARGCLPLKATWRTQIA